MTVPILTFFNNKGGVGKTSLVYHLAWMMSLSGHRVLACDLDPQANLTSMFLNEPDLEQLYNSSSTSKSTGSEPSARTIYECVKPLTGVGDLLSPTLQEITPELSLLPGDLQLTGFEATLSAEWPNALGAAPGQKYRPFRILTSFWTVMQRGASSFGASIILADVGPNLGAINRSCMIAADHIVVPLGADLFSLQGLRSLGPALRDWRSEWRHAVELWGEPEFEVPDGAMMPIGYVVQQHSVRLSRPVKAYDKWVRRVPQQYAEYVLGDSTGPYPLAPELDESSLGTIKHYRSLVPMAQEAHKPLFLLKPADGAIGSHSAAAVGAYADFSALAEEIVARMKI